MSYILDALRKAEAERERGHVPSIHAQPAFAGARPAAPPSRSRTGLVVLAGIVLLAVVAAAAYLLGKGPTSDAGAKAPLPVTGAATTPAPMPTATPTPTPAPAPAPVAAAPAPVAAPTPTPTTTPRVIATAPAPAAASRKTKPTALPAASSAPAITPATAIPAANGTDPIAGKIYATSELPDAIRSQLPTLAIGGSMFSPVRADRILIVNGQVLHEGEKITPELTLEQVRVKSAVLAFRGYRYTVAF